MAAELPRRRRSSSLSASTRQQSLRTYYAKAPDADELLKLNYQIASISQALDTLEKDDNTHSADHIQQYNLACDRFNNCVAIASQFRDCYRQIEGIQQSQPATRKATAASSAAAAGDSASSAPSDITATPSVPTLMHGLDALVDRLAAIQEPCVKALALALAARLNVESNAACQTLIHTRWGGNTTLAHIAAQADNLELLQKALAQRIDLEVLDATLKPALYYAFDKPNLLRLFFVAQRPTFTDLEHPSGLPLTEYLDNIKHSERSTLSQADAVLVDYHRASVLFNKKFFTELLTFYIDYLVLLSPIVAEYEQLQATVDATTQEKRSADPDSNDIKNTRFAVDVLSAILQIHALGASSRKQIDDLFMFTESTELTLDRIDANEVNNYIQTTVDKLTQSPEANAGLAAAQRSSLVTFARRNAHFIRFLQRYCDMFRAVDHRFWEWKGSRDATIKQHIQRAKDEYYRTKLDSLLQLFTRQVTSFTTERFKSYYITHINAVMCADKPETASHLLSTMTTNLQQWQSVVDTTVLTDLTSTIRYVVALSTAEQRRTRMTAWQARLSAPTAATVDATTDVVTTTTTTTTTAQPGQRSHSAVLAPITKHEPAAPHHRSTPPLSATITTTTTITSQPSHRQSSPTPSRAGESTASPATPPTRKRAQSLHIPLNEAQHITRTQLSASADSMFSLMRTGVFAPPSADTAVATTTVPTGSLSNNSPS